MRPRYKTQNHTKLIRDCFRLGKLLEEGRISFKQFYPRWLRIKGRYKRMYKKNHAHVSKKDVHKQYVFRKIDNLEEVGLRMQYCCDRMSLHRLLDLDASIKVFQKREVKIQCMLARADNFIARADKLLEKINKRNGIKNGQDKNRRSI